MGFFEIRKEYAAKHAEIMGGSPEEYARFQDKVHKAYVKAVKLKQEALSKNPLDEALAKRLDAIGVGRNR